MKSAGSGIAQGDASHVRSSELANPRTKIRSEKEALFHEFCRIDRSRTSAQMKLERGSERKRKRERERERERARDWRVPRRRGSREERAERVASSN
jgi:hypothetical protein